MDIQKKATSSIYTLLLCVDQCFSHSPAGTTVISHLSSALAIFSYFDPSSIGPCNGFPFDPKLKMHAIHDGHAPS